jgi:4-diphosphocytidyl-2-C-methyl-D-erythritol kinase
MNDITVRANAKLTLALHVTGVRDDGFHDLDAIVVSVSAPADIVTIAIAPTDQIVVMGPAGAGVPTDGTNLAARALAILRDHALDVPPVRVTLDKTIPHGAGLGGGSADAAAVLWAARELFRLDLDDQDLMTFGEQIGSDVPVCIVGGMAHMSGRGEHVEPLPWAGPFGVVIAVPPFAMSTPAVYRAWDVLGGPESTRIVRPTLNGPALRNDLEPAAEVVDPQLVALRDAIVAATGYEPVLAGSGSAYALCVADATEADAVAATLRGAEPHLTVFAGHTTPHGIEAL